VGLDLRRICGSLMRLRKLRDVGLGRSISPGSDMAQSSGCYLGYRGVNLYPLIPLANMLLQITRASMYKV
jgi:hypothetical protein